MAWQNAGRDGRVWQCVLSFGQRQLQATARHPAATVAPMALLVSVFGMGASKLLLYEPLQSWKLAEAALVMGDWG